MSHDTQPLGREQLTDLLAELSDELAAAGARAQLFVVGGAAMALAYDESRSTRHIDAAFAPAPIVRRAGERVATRHGLEPDWLNDAAKGFMPGDDAHPRTVFESGNLLVQVPSPQYLLAMKIYSGRLTESRRDLDDAVTLFNLAGYTSVEQVIELLERTYPARLLLPRHQYIAYEVAERAQAARTRRACSLAMPPPGQRRPGPARGTPPAPGRPGPGARRTGRGPTL